MNSFEASQDDLLARTEVHAREKIEALKAELARYETLLATIVDLRRGQPPTAPRPRAPSARLRVAQEARPERPESIGQQALRVLAAHPRMSVPEVTKALYGPTPSRSNAESVRTALRRLDERGVLTRDEDRRYTLAEVDA